MTITKYDLIPCTVSGLLLPIALTIPYAGIISWVVLIPFFMAIEHKSPWSAFRLGLLTGTIANAVGFYWLVGTIHRFGGFPYPVSLIFQILLSMYSGLSFAIFAYVTGKLGLFRRPGLVSALLIAAVWTSVEFLFPLLFPYGVTNSQADYIPLMQVYDLLGMYSLSFLIVLVNVALMRFLNRLRAKTPNPGLELVTSLVLVVLTLTYGFWRMDAVSKSMTEAPKIKVGIVQANFDFFEKNEGNEDAVSRRHAVMSESFGSPDLIIWPETAIQAWVSTSSTFLVNDGKVVLPDIKGTYFLVGGLSYKTDKDERYPISEQDVEKFNTAFLADSQGRILGRYHKTKLLLFGEYLPLSSYFPALKQISPATGDFTPGNELNLLEIEEKNIKIAPLICYEDIIPSFSRRLVNNGANLIVNLTNDAWFGRTLEPHQHLVVSVPRAVETRLYLVRATNTGVSAVIDPLGRVVARTEIFERTTFEQEIGIMNGEKTLYTRIGNVLPWGCLAFWVGFFVVTRLRKS
jgi:apolipoprotein N-acyltransferase